MRVRSMSVEFLVLVSLCGCSGGGDGSGVSDTCNRYLDCMTIEEPANAEQYQSTYAKDGECWTADSSAAQDCTQACQDGLAAATVLDPAQPACWLSDAPEAQALFGAIPVWSYTLVDGKCYDATATFAASEPGQDFTLTPIWENGFFLDLQCSIDGDLAFNCDMVAHDGHRYVFTGSFDAGFSQSTLEQTVDEKTHCSYTGVPRSDDTR
jgi:hypothetical protein